VRTRAASPPSSSAIVTPQTPTPFMASSTELHRSTALPTPPLPSPPYLR
jgi:hypothetical protein